MDGQSGPGGLWRASSGAAVACRVLAGRALGSRNRWPINKGLAGARPLPEGLGPQLCGRSRWTGQTHGRAAGPCASSRPQHSRVTAVVRQVRRVWGCGAGAPSPREECAEGSCRGRAETGAQISMRVILKPSTMLSMLRMKVSSFE